MYLLVDGEEIPEGAVTAFETYRIVPCDLKKPLPALEEILQAEKIRRS